jgi:hypothetical protein
MKTRTANLAGRLLGEAVRFGGSAANVNCALRTLRRMLHKGEEWNLLIKVPKFKLWPEQGRKLRLDDDAEQKLLAAAKCCSLETSDVRAVSGCHHPARDTGMRNGRELYRIRTENLDWNNRIVRPTCDSPMQPISRHRRLCMGTGTVRVVSLPISALNPFCRFPA